VKRLFQGGNGTARLIVVAAVTALVIGATGAVAGQLITGKDIKNGSIAAKELKKKLRQKINKAGSAGAPGQTGSAGPAGADGADAVVNVTALSPDPGNGDGVAPPAWAERVSAGCGSGNGDASVDGSNLEFDTPDGNDAVAVSFNGYNGLKLRDISYISYHAKYEQTGTDFHGGTPYFRIFTEGFDHAVIFSPNTQPGAVINSGEWGMFVPTSGTVRYDDDAGNNPDISWKQLIADHGGDTIAQIRIQGGCGGNYTQNTIGSADQVTVVAAGSESVFNFGAS